MRLILSAWVFYIYCPGTDLSFPQVKTILSKNKQTNKQVCLHWNLSPNTVTSAGVVWNPRTSEWCTHDLATHFDIMQIWTGFDLMNNPWLVTKTSAAAFHNMLSLQVLKFSPVSQIHFELRGIWHGGWFCGHQFSTFSIARPFPRLLPGFSGKGCLLHGFLRHTIFPVMHKLGALWN